MRIDHIAIAVRSLDDALHTFSALWELEADSIHRADTDRVREAMLPIGDTHLQLLEATSDDSPIAKFVEKRGEGLHHIAVEVDDLEAELARLSTAGAQLIDSAPRLGGGGRMVAFVHPTSTSGVLIELIQR